MRNINYATTVSPKHDVRVKTWEENNEHWFEIRVDGRVRETGSLGAVGE